MHTLLSHAPCHPDARRTILQRHPYPLNELRPPQHPKSSIRQLQHEHPGHCHSQPSIFTVHRSPPAPGLRLCLPPPRGRQPRVN
ncbi:hypothetical protein ARMSODRAFT_133477 [Armillaria solidipes]|uniref:Uncharacterized protein n=1 Tax=Armillaria solidipes TaxID=1076256 RepID=A0A2H3AU23_9AGAR|nr:hypothetical protein ARMSODRAFT_133477 [Armillaria solidipes]